MRCVCGCFVNSASLPVRKLQTSSSIAPAPVGCIKTDRTKGVARGAGGGAGPPPRNPGVAKSTQGGTLVIWGLRRKIGGRPPPEMGAPPPKPNPGYALG